jgi:hypothetical protein
VGESLRQLELENKKSPFVISGGGGLGYPYSGTPPYLSYQLPSHLTEEDIVAAHMEATMEESCSL